MAELLVKISYIAFAGAVVCLILAVILFIKFKIPTVIGDLSGKNAKKAIQQLQREILDNYDNYREAIQRTYTNAEERKQ